MIHQIEKTLNKFISTCKAELKRDSKNEQKKFDKIQASRCEKWFEIKGDETLRLNYSLNENSIVFDIGGYKGEFARDIYCKYNATIYVFEPIPEFYEIIKERFINNSKIKVFNFGLGSQNYSTQINIEDNSSSIFKKGNNSREIEIRSFNDFIFEYNIPSIDLAKINIEGSEYDLLDSIIESNNITKIHNIQVQFHDFIIENANGRMSSIQKELSRTHKLTYQFEFVWENWEINPEQKS
jgi:FkbM family methyltransferase